LDQLTEQTTRIAPIAQAVLEGRMLGRDDALYLLQAPPQHRWELFYWANRIRLQCFGPGISLCAIASAHTAGCSQDCRFCAQSSHYPTRLEPHTTSPEQLLAAARAAQKQGAHSFGIVSSGHHLDDSELEPLARVISNIAREENIECCVSLGCLSPDQAQRLYDLGVRKYNHNLETSRNFFPRVVTTHSYDDRINTVKAAQKAGMRLCCGGIIGLGESLADRVDLAFTLRELNVDTVPINFLNPIPGTPLENLAVLAPMTALQTIAMFRFVLPDKQIKIAGGREKCLRDLQSWMFYAGASATMIGNYLTTEGRSAADDFKMLADLELELYRPDQS
jgi:biotin synthase